MIDDDCDGTPDDEYVIDASCGTRHCVPHYQRPVGGDEADDAIAQPTNAI